MKFFTGLAISAALVCAAGTADAQMVGGRVGPASDFDAPYFGGPPPAAVPEPEAPAPRYYDRGYYGQDRGYEPGYYTRIIAAITVVTATSPNAAMARTMAMRRHCCRRMRSMRSCATTASRRSGRRASAVTLM